MYCHYSQSKPLTYSRMEVNLNFKGLTFYDRHTCSLVSLGGQSYMYIFKNYLGPHRSDTPAYLRLPSRSLQSLQFSFFFGWAVMYVV
jgi:hypothetical protein